MSTAGWQAHARAAETALSRGTPDIARRELNRAIQVPGFAFGPSATCTALLASRTAATLLTLLGCGRRPRPHSAGQGTRPPRRGELSPMTMRCEGRLVEG